MIATALLFASGLLVETAPSRLVHLSRIERPPRIREFRGGGSPEGLARVSGFVQRVPRDGAAASEETEVFLAYDEESLYAVFVCRDREPRAVRGRRVPRGSAIEEDDLVSIQLDTFRDRRRAYAFTANPLGVQSTAMWVEGGAGDGWDRSFDTVWWAEGELTDFGYVVSMKIPFRSLRFPPRSQQTWGLMLQRNIPRRNEESFWPSYSSRIEGRLNQAGTLTGIDDVSPGRNVELIPHAVARSSRFDGASDPFDADVGLDGKLVLKDSIVLDATVNPDFSQVESDEPQVTVNQRFEVFFPEKRPFFLENASYFETPVNLLFTRRISDPTAGVRLTGKLGPYAVGALASDGASPDGRGLFSALRFQRELHEQSSVGLLYASRTAGELRNEALGVDGRFKVSPNWTAGFQAVRSSTSKRGDRSISGPAYAARVSRAGRRLTYDFEYQDRSPLFRTDTGFEPRTDFRSIHQLLSWRFRPEGERLVAFGPDVLVRRLVDHSGAELELTYGPALHFELMRQTRIGVYALRSQETLRPSDHPGIEASKRFPVDVTGLMFSTAFLPELSADGHYVQGRGIHLFPEAGAPESVRSRSLDVGLVARPAPSLTVGNRYLFTRLEGAFTNHIFRSSWNYQLTRPLSLRMILQYDGLSVRRTRLPSGSNWNVDVLLRYFVNHGTALYVGYNANRSDGDGIGSLPTVGRRSSLFFFKLSYLLRP